MEVVLVNSHDGTSRYELSLGAFRLACLNGMMVAEGLVEIVKIRHTGNVIQEVLTATHNMIQRAPLVADAIRLWKGIELKQSEALLLAQGAHRLRFEEGANAPSYEKLLQTRRREDNATDLWTTFNRIQENVVNGGLRAYTKPTVNEETGRFIPARAIKTHAIKGIAENSKLNRELWTLAAEMAKIKTA